VRKFQEILQVLKPLISWRSWWANERYTGGGAPQPTRQGFRGKSGQQTLTLPRPGRREPADWVAVEDSQIVRRSFSKFRSFMYACNRKTKINLGESPLALWESGKLAGNRVYFFLQPWNDRGYLFEETPRGWVVARAEKIADRDQFVRERLAWDHVILHQATDRPGLLRVTSEQMGEGIVSLSLYEDFMSQAFKAEA